MIYLIKKFCILSLAIIIAGCGGSMPDASPAAKRNAELTVTYFGKTVSQSKGHWSSEARIRSILNNPGNKYLIFSAPWCTSCKTLRKAIDQAELTEHVEYINIDEKWASHVAQFYNIRTVPTMLVIAADQSISGAYVGPGQIVVHLIININPK